MKEKKIVDKNMLIQNQSDTFLKHQDTIATGKFVLQKLIN